jgi:hypothetical protein
MLAPKGGINHKLLSSKELRNARMEMQQNAPKAEKNAALNLINLNPQ